MGRWLVLISAFAFALFVGFLLADRLDRGALWSGDRRLQTSPTPDPILRELATRKFQANDTQQSIAFEEVASRVGLDFVHSDGATGEFLMPETTGAGVAVVDFDNDGLLDFFFANGAKLPVRRDDRSRISQLFHNRLGQTGFTNVTDPARVGIVAYGQGVASGDLDNDGFVDLVLGGFGSLVLLQNQGDGTFREFSILPAAAGDRWITSVTLADLDRDGDLDLYAATYADVSIDQPLRCQNGNVRSHCLPRSYPAQPDFLFENQLGLRFHDVSSASGVLKVEPGRGLGVAIADFNNDGWADIFVANDTSQNYLFLNQRQPGKLLFVESASELGVDYNGEGRAMAGMGVGVADVNADGWLDLAVTDYYQEKNALFVNGQAAGFSDESNSSGLGPPSRDRLAWAAVFLDADLDGRSDLFVANGHVSDIEATGVPYKMLQQFFRNTRSPSEKQLTKVPFEDISDRAGPYFREKQLGRSAAWADCDNNGLPDLVLAHCNGPAGLLLNRTKNAGNWIGFEFVGRRSNRDGLNVRVTIQGEPGVSEVYAGAGYFSSSDTRLILGRGPSDTPITVVITWPDGNQQRLEDVRVGRYHRVIEP